MKIEGPDKFSAVWLSHSSIGDFLKCPRLYYLHNMYKNPKTGRKINITSPALALGVAVHEVLEPLAWIKTEDRFKQDFKKLFEEAWKPVSGKLGGFKTEEKEIETKNRGWEMIQRVLENPGPLSNPALRMVKDKKDLPYFFLMPEENIILCGKIDWLEYLPETDSLHILDFKTGRSEEKEDSLQLPIYLLLLKNLKSRPVSKASYWYIDRDNEPKEKPLPSVDESFKKLCEIGLQVKKARKAPESEGLLKCPHGGCRECEPFEKILRGEAEYVGVGNYNQELYIL